MDRLTERELYDGKVIYKKCSKTNCKERCCDCPVEQEIPVRLKDYEDAEENGMLKMLPCRIDDEMWAIRRYSGVLTVQKGFVSEMFFTKEMKLMIVVKHVARGVFGEKVFLTREAAEQALAKMKGV